MIPLPAYWMRGGTSNALFVDRSDLPADPARRDAMLLRAMGSGHQSQIDGMGTGHASGSKIAICGPSTRDDCDVDYLFGQVLPRDGQIEYGANCGNISAAVGVFAIETGMIEVPAEATRIEVSIHLVNSGHRITSRHLVRDGKVRYEGDYEIAGVPGRGAPIELDWSTVVGTVTGSVLPTGRVTDLVPVSGDRAYAATFVDAGNLVMHIHASSLGLSGRETPAALTEDKALIERLERVRLSALDYVSAHNRSGTDLRGRWGLPIISMVAEPDHPATPRHFDARVWMFDTFHPTFPGSGTFATGVCARIPGSVVNLASSDPTAKTVDIGHAAGVLRVDCEASLLDGELTVSRAVMTRTARPIMRGVVLV